MTPKWNKIITQSKIRLKHGSPTILTCLGAIGVVATSVLAIQATPKAVRKIRADNGISWIDFNHHKTVLNDGLEVYVIDIEYPPRLWDEDDC